MIKLYRENQSIIDKNFSKIKNSFFSSLSKRELNQVREVENEVEEKI
jgi:hypothetical protein